MRSAWAELRHEQPISTLHSSCQVAWHHADGRSFVSCNLPIIIVYTAGHVKRSEWVERNVHIFGDLERPANLVFDDWDKNKDLRLDEADVGVILKEADRNSEWSDDWS